MRGSQAPKTPAPQPAAAPPVPPAVGLGIPPPEDIDRYGELHRLCGLHKAIEQEREDLKTRLEAAVADHPPEQEIIARGNIYQVRITPKKNQRKITNRERLRKFLGVMFKDVWSVTLDAIDKYVPKEKHPLFLVEDRTGRRDVIPTLLAQAGERAA